jgi:hypothetical protein
MTDRCIHGFEPQNCATCRRCPHGILESRCGVCAPRTAREASIMLANDEAKPSEEHRGYEILYAAGQRSWHYRADEDGPVSTASYRSAFQARRAVDQLLDATPANSKKKR